MIMMIVMLVFFVDMTLLISMLMRVIVLLIVRMSMIVGVIVVMSVSRSAMLIIVVVSIVIMMAFSIDTCAKLGLMFCHLVLSFLRILFILNIILYSTNFKILIVVDEYIIL